MKTVCEIDGLEVRLITTITDNDLGSLIAKMKEYARKTDIKGFRRGYVPLSRLKQEFVDVLMNDVSRLALKEVIDTINSQELHLILNPIIDHISLDKIDWYHSDTYVLHFLAGQIPEITIDYGDKDIRKAVVHVLKKTVDMYIENILSAMEKDGKRPELNEDLFNQFYTKGTVKTEREFRKLLKLDIMANLETESRNKVRKEIKDYLVSINKFHLPSRFLTNYYFANYEDEGTDAFKVFMDGVRWDIIEDKIIKDAKITVTDKMVRDKVNKNLKRKGVNNSKEIVDGLMSNQTEVSAVKREIQKGMILDYLMDKMHVKDKNISYEDFHK